MAITHHSSKPPITQGWLLIAMTACVIAILSINAFLLMREHRSVELAAIRTSLNIVRLIDRDVQNTVEQYDSALSALIRVSKRGDLGNLSQPLKQMLMFDKAEETPDNGGFFMLNAQGDLVVSSLADYTPGKNYSHWQSFIEQRDSSGNDLFISHPFPTEATQGACCISFSRRISGADGSFQGVAIAQMKVDYFRSLFQKLDLGANSTISLINTDGTLLIQQPGRDNARDDLRHDPIFNRLLKEHKGSFIAVSSKHGQEELYSFSEVGKLPLVVVVSLATEDVFASWRRNALLVGCVTLMLCITLLGLTWLLGRELQLRRKAEQTLEAMIRTDPLTELANRRKLDETLTTEWLRAQRTRKPLSLIMIDVDHFKSFNDTYGHPYGDEALRLVGKTLKTFVRRSTDLVARYGGEEFAMVLPDTHAEGAAQLAERIRHTIEQLPPIKPGGIPITVSLGTCTQQVTADDSQTRFLHCADQALYEAKKNGRNCVVSRNAAGDA